MWIAVAALALAVQPPPAAGPVFKITLAADLDCTRSAAELERALAEAHTAKASRIVIELGGNAAREHVIHRVAAALRACTIDTQAQLADDHDRAVGMGQALIAQFADTVIADRRVTLRGQPIRQPAQETVASKARDDELREWLAVALERREARAGVRELLLGPVRPCRVAGEPPEIRDGPLPAGIPMAEKGTMLTHGNGDAGEWAIPGSAFEDLGLATTPRAWPPLAPARVTERRVTATAAGDLAAARALADRVDVAIAAAADALKLDPDSRAIARSRFRDAAAKAHTHLAAATRDTAALAAILDESPEIMESPAPGQGAGTTPASTVARWRSAVSSRRDRAERVRLKAERFAALRD